MVKLFSYGTLREQNVQQAIFGRLVVGADDALVGYKLKPATVTHERATAISGRAEHTTVLSTGQNDDQVAGIVFDLTEDELRRADSYERCGLPANPGPTEIRMRCVGVHEDATPN